MFQYALGRHLSLKNKTRLILDLSFLDLTDNINHTKRHFELNNFNVTAECQNIRSTYLKAILSRIKFKLKMTNYVRETSFAFNPDILNLKGNTYLDGFWQTEKYFRDIKDILKKDFVLKTNIDGRNMQISNQIAACNAVSVHVRRGDYITATPTYQNLCDSNYYQTAIATVQKLVQDPVFFVFSDDISWVKSNLEIPCPHYYIEHNQNETSYFDLFLTSLCKHNIIANSSFSWWGAWLNDHETKKVIAPASWFNDPKIDTSDLIPETWILV